VTLATEHEHDDREQHAHRTDADQRDARRTLFRPRARCARYTTNVCSSAGLNDVKLVRASDSPLPLAASPIERDDRQDHSTDRNQATDHQRQLGLVGTDAKREGRQSLRS
jgi:hypothetical protein